MRLRVQHFTLLTLPSFLACVACGDDAPIYPPIVIVQVGEPSGVGSPSSGGGSGNQPNAQTGGASSNSGGASGGATGLFAHCSTFLSGPEPKVQTACDLANLKDGGELTGDISVDRTLKTGYFYTLKGGTRVMPGKTLTIEPCVKVIGKDSDAVLVVTSSSLGDPKKSCTYASGSMTAGGKLVAEGEPMAPIIFTSANPPGKRRAGDWGGVMMLGNAQNDLAQQNVRVPIEGLTKSECHGYHSAEFNAESSGKLAYVRIEYASRQVSTDNETNGLTFGSIGSGTEVHHVMVSNSADDCFEWFGGAVNADHLIALNCDDDAFDGDNGYSGKLQFLFGRQFTTSTENDPRGLEITQGNGIKKVLTSEQLSNVTLCGNGPRSKQTSEHGGGYFNNTPQVRVMNTFITGFSRYGLWIEAGNPSLDHLVLFDQLPLFGPTGKEAWDTGTANSSEDPDRFCDCWANPPAPVPATPIAGGKPTGFDDDQAAYVGAFADADADSNWMRGSWVDWSDK